METTIEHDRFGELTWESAMNWWIGRFEYNPQQIVWIHIYARDTTDFLAIDQAHTLLTKIQRTENILRDFAFSKFKDLYLKENHEAISADAFRENLALESLSFRQENGCNVAFDDGQMFGGHLIIVFVDNTGTPIDADLAG